MGFVPFLFKSEIEVISQRSVTDSQSQIIISPSSEHFAIKSGLLFVTEVDVQPFNMNSIENTLNPNVIFNINTCGDYYYKG